MNNQSIKSNPKNQDLWINKYKPTTINQIIGNTAQINNFKDFIEEDEIYLSALLNDDYTEDHSFLLKTATTLSLQQVIYS